MLVFAGLWDTLSAKIIEKAGFDGIWVGSFTTSACLNAALDIGLRTPREHAELVQRLKGVTNLPMVVDGEEGWGGTVHAAYWVREFERAGAEGIMFDDKGSSLASPYVKGPKWELEPLEESIAKFRAAVDARSSPDFLIIARSSARISHGMEEQIRRLKAYQKAGADIVWASSTSADTLKLYRRSFEGPLWATCNPGYGDQANMSVDEFRKIGIQVLCYESPVFLASVKTCLEMATEIRAKGSIAHLRDKILPLESFLSFMGYDDVPAFLEKYRPKDSLG